MLIEDKYQEQQYFFYYENNYNTINQTRCHPRDLGNKYTL